MLHLFPVSKSAVVIAGQSGYTSEVKTIDLPSGDHLALSASVQIAVSFFALRRRAGGRIEIGQPDLLPTLSTRKKENRVPVGSELDAAVAGLGNGQLDRPLLPDAGPQSPATTAPVSSCFARGSPS